MRTRCPRCQTVFRITPEQLRARGGKVRCGHCQSVFNALETLIEEPATMSPMADIPAPDAEAPHPEPTPAVEPLPIMEPAPDSVPETETEAVAETETTSEPEPEAPLAPEADTVQESEPEPLATVPPDEDESPVDEPARDETPEETTLAAREAGLVAARELAETPGYNRWAAGTLASSPLAGLESEHSHAKWPFILVSAILALTLLLQLAHYFRTDLTQRFPSLEATYSALGIEVPLPRQVDQVSIETSDLQSDNARGLLVLQAMLKNRAAHAQAWPALELTLTDTHDAVVARRVLEAPDYLPPKADATAFPANSETSLRLWIQAKDVAAAGYRLYVFYP